MREKIKKLIELAELEKWVGKNSPMGNNSIGSTYNLCPNNAEFPKISSYGVQIDNETYTSLSDDERTLINGVFFRRKQAHDKLHNQIIEDKLDKFLSKYIR